MTRRGFFRAMAAALIVAATAATNDEDDDGVTPEGPGKREEARPRFFREGDAR